MRKRWILVGAVGSALAVTACGGGGHAKQAGPSTTTTTTTGVTTGGGQVSLALAGGGVVTASLPARPLATTGTIVSGVSLEVWQVQRTGSAVTVVFALHDTTDQDASATDDAKLQEALDVNASNPHAPESLQVNNVVNNVGLLDTSTLKEYQTFCDVDSSGVLTNCLASVNGVLMGAGDRRFFAAVVAAPPESTKTATLVTGVGSVPGVPISG